VDVPDQGGGGRGFEDGARRGIGSAIGRGVCWLMRVEVSGIFKPFCGLRMQRARCVRFDSYVS
jgi:hypothetical protein